MESLLVVFPFADADFQQTEAVAQSVMLQKFEGGEHTGRREAFFAGRAALAFAFKYLKLKAFVRPSQPYGYLEAIDEKGKRLSHLFCNITHTEKMALAAVCAAPVGVDIERLDRPVDKVVRRILSEEEKSALDRGNPELERQGIRPELALWCAKEAYTKALGLGLGAGLDQITVDIQSQPPFPVLNGVLGPYSLEEPVIEVRAQDNYLISLCTEADKIQSGFKKLLFNFS